MDMTAAPNETFPAGKAIAQIAFALLDKPYQARTLEQPGKERLVVNVSAFDCTTFVETVLALAQCVRGNRMTPAAFKHHLRRIRYRGGKIAGYASRLHYFTDWLRDNGKKKILTDISATLDATPIRRKINYMTANRDLYPALKRNESFDEIKKVELRLSRRIFNIIGKDKINTATDKIQEGDIIAFAAGKEGLDVAHVGFAVRQGKSLQLLHASPKEGKVVISSKTLSAYLKSQKNFTGIIVARPSF